VTCSATWRGPLFNRRTVHTHEAVNRPLNVKDDGALSFISECDQRLFTLNRINGVVPTRLVVLLHNLWHEPCTLYFSITGEWEDKVSGRAGGDSALTNNGREYAAALAQFMAGRGGRPLLVMTSSELRARQTCAPLTALPNCTVTALPTLDDVSYGDCDGHPWDEVRSSLPHTYSTVVGDPYDIAWPNGESVRQVYDHRLDQHILAIQGSSQDTLVVASKPLVQGLLRFFDTQCAANPRDAIRSEFPLHHVIRLAPLGNTRVLTDIDLEVPLSAETPASPTASFSASLSASASPRL
jgi:6-phosphofructo-2-kinase/fructose-2,6-biphosphatase 2